MAHFDEHSRFDKMKSRGTEHSFKRKSEHDFADSYNHKQKYERHDDQGPRFERWHFTERRSGNRNVRRWQEEEEEEDPSDYFEDVPKPEKPRKHTVSIAIPASIIEETCRKDELRTYVIGQLARAANIYSVDEIIVYDDKCWRRNDSSGISNDNGDLMDMMRVILEYQECPQYLRKYFFGFHRHLSKVGVLNALNAPHHLLSRQWCEYREGVVLERGSKSYSFVDIGLGSDAVIDKKLDAGLRVTVKLSLAAKETREPFGKVVSPDEPRQKGGYYWGYTVRVAHSLAEVISGSRFKEGYDLLIGTSDKGDDIQDTEYPKFKHALIVFGGVEGLEAAVEADDQLEATEPRHLFDFYTNTCPLQQSRTIRTEEAVLISLCALQGKLVPKRGK